MNNDNISYQRNRERLLEQAKNLYHHEEQAKKILRK